mgnify:CR=1 FL=1
MKSISYIPAWSMHAGRGREDQYPSSAADELRPKESSIPGRCLSGGRDIVSLGAQRHGQHRSQLCIWNSLWVLVESFCSEQNARMQAMQNATDSAAKMLGELNITYNRVRQADITQELTEVIGGANAQKRK